MTTKRTIEVFSAGCPACEEAIQIVIGEKSPDFHSHLLTTTGAGI